MADVWSVPPDLDLDGDGVLDALGLDFDGDGLRDDALADLDGDGTADHAVLDVPAGARWFTDDGTGTWAVQTAAPGGGPMRWFALDGVEQTGGPLADLDGDGVPDGRLYDTDADGLADRVVAEGGALGYADVDGDGHWDLRLFDSDGDGAADDATPVSAPTHAQTNERAENVGKNPPER